MWQASLWASRRKPAGRTHSALGESPLAQAPDTPKNTATSQTSLPLDGWTDRHIHTGMNEWLDATRPSEGGQTGRPSTSGEARLTCQQPGGSSQSPGQRLDDRQGCTGLLMGAAGPGCRSVGRPWASTEGCVPPAGPHGHGAFTAAGPTAAVGRLETLHPSLPPATLCHVRDVTSTIDPEKGQDAAVGRSGITSPGETSKAGNQRIHRPLPLTGRASERDSAAPFPVPAGRGQTAQSVPVPQVTAHITAVPELPVLTCHRALGFPRFPMSLLPPRTHPGPHMAFSRPVT